MFKAINGYYYPQQLMVQFPLKKQKKKHEIQDVIPNYHLETDTQKSFPFSGEKQSTLVFLDVAHFGFGLAEVQYHVTVGMTGDKKREYGYQDWSGIPVTQNIVIK